jgi:hypothetical protein
MADPIVNLEPTELSVEPGGQVRLVVTVRNPGEIVENYRIEVLSEVPGTGPATWAEVNPPELSVYPKEKGTTVVVLSPPAGTTTSSGRFPFGVRVRSTVPPHASAVEEGDIAVGRVFGLQAVITPTTSSGRWRGHHLLTYTNWGNAPVRLNLTVRDPDEKLGFLLHPAQLDLPLGASASARLTARTRKPFLRGTPARLPFEVVGEQDGAGPGPPPQVQLPNDPKRPVLSGALLQRPIVGRATVAVAGVAALVAAGAVVLALRTHHHAAAPSGSVALPDPPAGIIAKTVSADRIDVSWKAANDTTSYKVITNRGGKVVGTAPVGAGVESFQAKDLDANALYCFAVRAVTDPTHFSAASRLTCARTLPLKTSGSPTAPVSGASTPGSGTPVTSSSAPGSTGSSGSVPPTGSTAGNPGPNGPTQVIPPNDYVIAIGLYSSKGGAKAAAVEAARFSLVVNGFIHSTDYESVTTQGIRLHGEFWAAYIGMFDQAGAQAALAKCNAAVQSVVSCNPLELGARKTAPATTTGAPASSPH